MTINNSSLTENSANYGGGIYTYGGTTTVSASTLSGNHADYYGGGIYSYYSYLTVSDSILSDNSAGYNGGAVYYFGTLNQSGNSFSGNSPNDIA